jgi:bifunctional DNase/RNase
MELVPVVFNKILQSQTYTCIVLKAEQKQFAIYTAPTVGKSLESRLADKFSPRPSTHDLMGLVFKGLDMQIKQVVINRREDTVYFARLFLQQQVGDLTYILEIDARPSDCVTLAFNTPGTPIPIYCDRAVLEQAIAVED